MSPLEKLKETEPARYHEALEAFAGGWDAFLGIHGTMLYVHGITNLVDGFEEKWAEYKTKHYLV